VEERGSGDLGRALGQRPDGFSAYFEAHNRNKRSITLDVRTEEGRRIIHQLAEKVDVVVENYRPGVMSRLGIGYEDLKQIKPTIIMASASGFGQRGPLAKRPSYDVIGQAMGGVMVAQGGADGDPQLITGGFADHVGAMFLAFGISMALIARDRFGVGQHVDSSLLGGQIAFQSMGFIRAMQPPPAEPVRGYPKGGNPLFRAYRCADGRWIAIGILDPKVFPALCRALGKPELVLDQRFGEPFARFQYAAELRDELAAVFGTAPRQEWSKRFADHDVPSGPVNDMREAADDPQVIENEYVIEVEHPHLGTIRLPGLPVRLSETPGRVRSTAPELGQHTEEVLLPLGYSWEEMEGLRRRGVI
jgi:CoA:oxalate CoA-transferase